MINVPRQTNAAIRKRRTTISLSLRIIVFLGVTLFFILHNVIKSDNTNASNLYHGRKLLNIIPVKSIEQVDILVVSENINVTYNSSLEEIFTTTTETYNLYTTNSTWENSTKEFNETEKNCTEPAVNEFPSDGLTRIQRKNGWIIIHVILACYCFWMMAAVCDDYFVPAIELFCKNTKVRKDVVGATFMAAASSSPELFINCVGTFVTKGDIGIGTIVGSAVFNILAVPACCGLFSKQLINLDWWPISRDCLVYSIAIFGLSGILYDGKVMWYEALLLVITYIIYIVGMYCYDSMSRKWITKWRRKQKPRPYREVNEITPLLTSGLTSKPMLIMEPILEISEVDKSIASQETINSNYSVADDCACNPWYQHNNISFFLYILRWPMTFLYWITIPDCRKHPKLKIITFLLSVCWIGILSYLVAFLITLIGDTLSIPDSVMGLTILAVGMSLPEAVSSIIVTIQGHGSMGICNSIGSNIFDILLSLGLPWFVKAYWIPVVPNEHWIVIKSTGLEYLTITLLVTLFCLYISFIINHFRLDWKIGIACTILYIGFLILSTMVELNFFFQVNLPVCNH